MGCEYYKHRVFSSAVTLKIRARSPNTNQVFIMPQFHIHANLVPIHLLVHEITSTQEKVVLNAEAEETHTKTIPPSPLVGGIIVITSFI